MIGRILRRLRGMFLQCHSIQKNNIVGRRMSVGAGVKLSYPHKLFVGVNVSIGDHCEINALSKDGFYFGNNLSIGHHSLIRSGMSVDTPGVKIGNNVNIGIYNYFTGLGGFEIGNDTIFAPNLSIFVGNHNYEDVNQLIRLQGVSTKGGVIIGNDCWIGTRVVILDGTVLGNHCVVAAGTIVNGKFPDNCVIAGVPARIIKQL